MYSSNFGSINASGGVNESGNSEALDYNVSSGDKISLRPTRSRNMLSSVLGACGFDGGRERSSSGGYVEFGNIGEENSSRTLGTFSGVFSPVALSMFSALLFLRVGFIVGNAGLLVTLLQFGIAYGILIFTVFSICAISTNGPVEGGGAYFMISRVLGPELGGSIGTLFFLANVVSSALYIVGCTEGLIDNFGPSGYLVSEEGILPDGPWWRFFYESMLNLLNLFVCLIGAGMFAKTSVVILLVVVICLLSVIFSFCTQSAMQIPIPSANTLINGTNHTTDITYTGLNFTTFTENLFPKYGEDYTSHGDIVTFASVFGVLFSGVTGIMAGANMSGELKDPARNIPRGTISAVIFTLIVYVTLSMLTAATTTRFLLQNSYVFLLPINVYPPFVTIGILTATFSASLSNLIGSSRVLEALAKDNVFGRLLNFVSKGVWRSNPLAAVFTSWLLVEVILSIGSLNTIAQVNSVLFLLSYLATNLACLGLDLSSAPNFRPSFKYFSWATALLGLIGTLFMMFIINPLYASSSIALCILLVSLLHLFSPARFAPWGSISQALIFHQVRKYLLLLDSRKDHVKFWRPQILLLVGNPRSSCPLIHFVNDLKKSGLYVLGHVKVGPEFSNLEEDPLVDEYPTWLTLIDHLKVKAFIELTVAKSVREGAHHLIRISGMGAMKPNTIVLGFYDDLNPRDFFADVNSHYQTHLFQRSAMDKEAFSLRKMNEVKKLSCDEYVAIMGDILKMKKNICVCRNFHILDKNSIANRASNYKYIDVWPINFFKPNQEDPFDTSSLFMLQLACIIRMVASWKHLQLRVFLCHGITSAADGDIGEICRNQEAIFQQLLQSLRITAAVYQVPSWTEVLSSLGGSPILHNQGPVDKNSKVYLQKVNKMIQEQSQSTAITFVYLPPPPRDHMDPSGSAIAATRENYLQCLSELTTELPPTVLVYGLSAVTSTTL
nr:PREDICTED: solute carrier family 12 member 9-like [Bemisia tabaci]